MNVFYLHPLPWAAARMHCDEHVRKMIIEYAQLLSTAHRMLDGEEYYDKTANGRRIKRWRLDDPVMEANVYKATHANHPSAVWVRENGDNYQWVLLCLDELADIYTYSTGRSHKTMGIVNAFLRNHPKNITPGPDDMKMSPPPACVPDDLKVGAAKSVEEVVESYRAYYRRDKTKFATWNYNCNWTAGEGPDTNKEYMKYVLS